MFSTRKGKNELAPIICGPKTAPPWQVYSHVSHREYHGSFTLIGQRGETLVEIPGRVVEWPRLPVDVYIFNPPPSLRQHRHGHCFQLIAPASRWFKLHWEKPAKTFDQARAYVELLMSEAM